MAHLNINKVKEENNKYNEKKQVEFNDGYYLYIKKYFSNKTIQEIFEKYPKMVEEAKEENLQDKLNNFPLINLLTCLVIEGFTDLKFYKSLKKKIKEFKCLMESHYYKEIVQALMLKFQKVMILNT